MVRRRRVLRARLPLVTAIIIATWIATAFAASFSRGFHILAPNAGAPFTLIGMVILTLQGAAIALFS